MKKTTEIVYQNLFAELRNEYLGENNTILPMSPYKMRKKEMLRKHIDAMPSYSAAEIYKFESGHQEKWREKVYDDERHSIDTSIETLDFLNIVIFNISYIERGTPSVQGLLVMAQYLRQQGDKVDFIKFEKWTRKLRISRLVSLLSSLLIEILGFEAEELPYRFKLFPKAYLWLYLQITDFRQRTPLQRTKTLYLFSPLATLALWKKATQTALDSIEE